MYRKLQHNFDIIQYLIKDISPDQLHWREDETSASLGEILFHLHNVEIWHSSFKSAALEPGDGSPHIVIDSSPIVGPQAIDLIDYDQAFEEYAYHRRITIERLKRIDSGVEQHQVRHNLFGQVALAELVAQIDAYDQTHIHRIEKIIHTMPLNPLLARAVYEIDHYYQHYRAHVRLAASVLDVGVGTGLALRYMMLQNPQIRFAGIDVRDLRLPGVQVPLQVYKGDVFPFEDNQFDISLLFYVLHHCRNPKRVLTEVTRVTRQKLIVIEEFDRPDADETSLDLTERQSHRALGLPSDLPYQLFDKPEFEAIIRSQGLAIVEQQPLPSRTTRPVQKYLYILGI